LKQKRDFTVAVGETKSFSYDINRTLDPMNICTNAKFSIDTETLKLNEHLSMDDTTLTIKPLKADSYSKEKRDFNLAVKDESGHTT
jgi:hypothetical protein